MPWLPGIVGQGTCINTIDRRENHSMDLYLSPRGVFPNGMAG